MDIYISRFIVSERVIYNFRFVFLDRGSAGHEFMEACVATYERVFRVRSAMFAIITIMLYG